MLFLDIRRKNRYSDFIFERRNLCYGKRDRNIYSISNMQETIAVAEICISYIWPKPT